MSAEAEALRDELTRLQRAYEIKCEARDQSWREMKQARTEADNLRATLAKVAELHQPTERSAHDNLPAINRCKTCGQQYPCLTAHAIARIGAPQ